MLTAAQIAALSVLSEQLLDPVVEFLLEDISSRVSEAGELTSTAAYQVWQAQNLGISQRKIKEEVAKRLEISLDEVEKLLTQAAEVGYTFDISQLPTTHAIPLAANSSLQQVLEATVKQAKEDLSNFTQTMGFVGSDGVCRELTQAYKQACDFAFQKTITGAQDYISAIRDATKNLVEKGIRYIDYTSGKHYSVEAAVRQNIMGGLGLMQEQISKKNHDLLGCDGWEISAHAASAPDHEPYQGKQYSDEEYTRLNNSLVRRIGTLNCGHAASPIILGINSPQYSEEELEKFRKDNEEGITVDGRHYTQYEATQRQRKIERAIRKQKHRILVDESLGDKDKLQTDQIRYHVLEQEYKRFSKAAGLRVQYERMEIVKNLDFGGSFSYNENRKQFDNYRKVLGDKVPNSMEEFQRMKAQEKDRWGILKSQYRVVNQYKVDSGPVSVDEMLELDDKLITEKRQNFTSRYKRSGNIAGAYVDGDYYVAHSKISGLEEAKGYKGNNNLVTLRTDRTFQYIDVKKADGTVRTDTYQDTEAKLFEAFADMYDNHPFKSVTMISERGMCDSCKGVMEQFKTKFPDVDVRVISHKKVEGDVWKYRRRKK